MKQASSQMLFIQVLQSSLRMSGITVGVGLLTRFIEFVREVCTRFPKDGTINIETWKKVKDRIRDHYPANGPEKN